MVNEKERLEELIGELKLLRDGGPPIFDTWIPAMGQLLGGSKSGFYTLRAEETQYCLDAVIWKGFHHPVKTIVSDFDAVVRKAPRRWGAFDPGTPEPDQRNRAMAFAPLTFEEEALEETLRREPSDSPAAARALGLRSMLHLFRKFDEADQWQLRAVVCDGDALLAWVGVFCEEKPSERQRRLLQRLVPALQRRLMLERDLSNASLYRGAVDPALELLSRPAFVINSIGRLLHANSAGRALHDRARLDVTEAVRAVARGQAAPGYFAVPLATGASTGGFVVVGPARNPEDERLAAARKRWALTRRQCEVLALVARGESNRAIAWKLGCAERTVELHVTALLAKAGVESRAALVAAFFRD